MDDQSGHIHTFQSKEVEETFEELLNQVDHSMTELDKEPNPNCHFCYGKGSFKSKPYTKGGHICFYRPCSCTKRK